jgi:twitching motility protein PilT
VLQAVISMRLVTRKDGEGRVPAVEIMRTTGLIRDAIENKEKTKLIRSAIEAGASQYGMQTFDQSLYSLYTEGLISFEEALRQASKPDEFKLKVDGIHSTSDMTQSDMEPSMAPDSMDPHGADSPFEFRNS